MKTVKLRIAVVIDEKGRWEACGSSYKNVDPVACADDQLASQHGIDISDERKHYWIEAEVAVPSVTTVQGEVRAR